MGLIDSNYNKKLELEDVLNDLLEEGVVDVDCVRLLKALLVDKLATSLKHPFVEIEKRNWVNPLNAQEKIDSEYLTSWLSKRTGFPLFYIDPLKIDLQSVTAVMSQAFARRFGILAVQNSFQKVVMATADPFDVSWEAGVSQLINNKKIERVLVSPLVIQNYLDEFYALSKSMSGANKTHASTGINSQNLEQMIEVGKKGNLDANDSHVVGIVDWLLQYAFDQRASDIHLEPRRDQGFVRFRIDGVLHQVYDMPPSVITAVTSRIKILSRMDVAEKRRPQDGRLKTRTESGAEIELRLSTMPTTFGEKLVLRIFNPETLLKSPIGLGFSKNESNTWDRMTSQAHGIVLLTGPTGSGKTTTLYSTLKRLAKPEVNVCTVEDPIELVEPAFNQMQVHHKIDLDFAAGIRTLLRQDPDIIMIGEMRDLETSEMAVQAALTGHLVISTLHTNDAPSAITRLIELGIAPYLINSSLIGVVAQRLVRTLCPHCKEEIDCDERQWIALVHPWRSKAPKKVYTSVGCKACRQSGYMGRIGIYEIMEYGDDLKTAVHNNASIIELRKEAIKGGLKPLRLSGAQKIASGVTTFEEVLKVTPASIQDRF
jgi:general secretion pathway protein E